jgi:PA domain-containing protein/LVIVD repeat-containing protein
VRAFRLVAALAVLAVGIVAAPLAASPDVPEVANWSKTANMTALGYSPRVLPDSGTGSSDFNSDLAFWGDKVYQGSYIGFRIIDVSKPSRPKELGRFDGCLSGSQGDVAVWGNVLIRAWDSPAGSGGRFCGDVAVPQGQEGIHIFDVSDPANPDPLSFVSLPCGTHTLTLVPDTANGRVLIYSSASSASAGCRGLSIVEVPLANPGAASFLRFEPSGNPLVGQPNRVIVNAPSSAAGTYDASGAAWHPEPTPEGVTAPIVTVNGPDPSIPGATPQQGCGPLIGFPAGAIALIDRGPTGCGFLLKAQNAEAAGASAVIIANNVAGPPTAMAGDSHEQLIPTVMISQADATLLKAGLPATGTVARAPGAENVDRACHDTSVVLGDAMKVACSGGNGVSVWTLDPAKGGSLTDPELLYSFSHGTSIGHTAAFTWDGKMIVFGHEPGGGTQAQCQASSSEFNKTIWFLDAETGMDMGHFVNPRPQGPTENCTWHNGTVVPLKYKNGQPRYVWLSGNYQSGISAVDFSDPENPFEFAFVDPPANVNPANPNAIHPGGDWSTYWYNGRIYESDMRRGLFIWRLDDSHVDTFLRTPHLNPQTAEFTITN